MVSTIIRVIASQDLREIAVKLVEIILDVLFLRFVVVVVVFFLSIVVICVRACSLLLCYYNFCFVFV